MNANLRIVVRALLIALASTRCFVSLADELPATSVEPAAAVVPAAPPASADAAPGAAVRFEQRPTQVGDRVVQRLGVQLTVATKIVQSGQVAHESTGEVRSQQQRTIDVLEVAEGRAVRSRVSFELSRRRTPDDAPADAATVSTALIPTPTEGKSYLLKRRGEELSVTDLEGAIPPLDEYKLVSESLEGVGRPNPLALVLAGREVAVGQRLFVPRDMAKALLGLNAPELGTVHRFELTLTRLTPPADGAPPLAVFTSTIEVKPEEGDDMAVTLKGELAVDPVTCRLASVDLAGPVHMSSIERTAFGIYQYSMDGDLRVAIRSNFTDAR